MLPPEYRLRIRWLIIAAWMFAASHAPSSLAATPLKVGDSFPPLAEFQLEGTLPDVAGKVVLVDFWASWCGPCKKSFPTMAELHTTYSSRGFAVVAISVDEKKAEMQDFIKKAKPPFTALRDAKGKLVEATGVETMPTSILVGADGRVLAIHSGYEGEATRKKYLIEVEAALKAAGR